MDSSAPGVAAGPNASWKWVITLALIAEGVSSQGVQTLDISVTSLPSGGANYRVLKTTANGNWFNGNDQALIVGDNAISVDGVSFDRSVNIQFSADDIEFDALSINGNTVYEYEAGAGANVERVYGRGEVVLDNTYTSLALASGVKVKQIGGTEQNRGGWYGRMQYSMNDGNTWHDLACTDGCKETPCELGNCQADSSIFIGSGSY
jgi:hypothetical protein